MKKIISLVLLANLPLGSVAWAGAPVVEESQNYIVLAKNTKPHFKALPDESKQRTDLAISAPKEAKQEKQQLSLLLSKIESMQAEIQQLRRQLETQQQELSTIHEQQVSLYKDLDKRLVTEVHSRAGALGEAINNPEQSAGEKQPLPLAAKATTKVNTKPRQIVSIGAKDDEQLSYVEAYEHIKNKDYSQAQRAMDSFLKRYPSSAYTPNAHYWLGELLLQKKNTTAAAAQFKAVLKRFPSSNKVAASAYKLGVTYAKAGKVSQAKKQLSWVKTHFPDTSTARLALNQLQRLKQHS